MPLGSSRPFPSGLPTVFDPPPLAIGPGEPIGSRSPVVVPPENTPTLIKCPNPDCPSEYYVSPPNGRCDACDTIMPGTGAG